MNRLQTHGRLERAPILTAKEALPPIAVDLAARALAIESIVRYLNYAAKVKGAHNSGRFADYYGSRAIVVLGDMDENSKALKTGFDSGIAVLTAEDALAAHGFDQDAIQLAHTSTQADINKGMGLNIPGGHEIRNDAVLAAKNVAQAVNASRTDN